MEKNYTHICILLDRSGSMKSIKDETIGGFNNFIEAQKKVEGKATLSLIQFDDRYEQNYMQMPIQEVQPLDEKSFIPRGWTRLLDAMGRAIISTGEGINALKEEQKPEKIVFVIMTDGQENDSKEFTQKEVADLVKQQQEEWKWEFVFMGSNQNAILTAQHYNIKGSNAITYAANSDGANKAIHSMSSNISSYRVGQKANMSFEKKDYEDQNEALGKISKNLSKATACNLNRQKAKEKTKKKGGWPHTF